MWEKGQQKITCLVGNHIPFMDYSESSSALSLPSLCFVELL